jgi:hypothetical protein
VRDQRLHFRVPDALNLLGNHAGHAIQQLYVLAQIPPPACAHAKAEEMDVTTRKPHGRDRLYPGSASVFQGVRNPRGMSQL